MHRHRHTQTHAHTHTHGSMHYARTCTTVLSSDVLTDVPSRSVTPATSLTVSASGGCFVRPVSVTCSRFLAFLGCHARFLGLLLCLSRAGLLLSSPATESLLVSLRSSSS